MAYYIFNLVGGEAVPRPGACERAAAFLRAGMWGVDLDEPHAGSLEAGDLVLVYLGAPERELVGRAELASPAHDWSEAEAQACPGDTRGGVALARIEEWDPPVQMSAVLSQLDPSGKAKADFELGVVRITAGEYATALAVAGRHPA